MRLTQLKQKIGSLRTVGDPPGRLVVALALLVAAATLRESTGASSSVGRVVTAGSMSLGRSGHTATRVGGGKVLIAGGMARNGEFLADCEVYDASTEKFSPAGKMSVRRVSHTATLLPNGQVLIAGGIEGRTRSEGHWRGRVLSSAELFDPATGVFRSTGNMSVARSSHAAVLLPSGKVLVLGGSGGGDWRELYASAELYDPATGKFSPAGTMATARIPHAVALLNSGHVLVAGGTGPNRQVLASAELYDPTKQEFTVTGSLDTARHKHAAVRLADGKVLVAGGSDARDWEGQLASAEIYDPKTRRFSLVGKMALARFKIHSAMVLLPDGKALLAGGGEQAEVYEPASGTFRRVSGTLNAPWHYATATLLDDHRVLIVGGYANNSEGTARAWLYER